MPANNYYCAECGARATKEPLVVHRKDSAQFGQGSLGSWRCTSKCKGKVKVKREKVKGKNNNE